MKKSQAAMEFLMAYGWAILAVAIAIGALAYFGVLKMERFFPENCMISTSSGLFCDDFTSSSLSGTITLRIKNILTQNAWVDSISLDTPDCSFSTADTEIAPDKTTDFVLNCASLSAGQKIKATITITYSIGETADERFSKTTTGQLTTIP